MSATSSYSVHGAPVGHGQHPGDAAAPGRVEPGRGPPDLEQHLLGDFLGLGRIAQYLPDHAVYRPGQLTVDRLEGLVIAPGDLGQEKSQIPGLPLSGTGIRSDLPYLWPVHVMHSRRTRKRIALNPNGPAQMFSANGW
jgi:hypothetical protein